MSSQLCLSQGLLSDPPAPQFWIKLNELKRVLLQDSRLWKIQKRLSIESGDCIVVRKKTREEVIHLIENLILRFIQSVLEGGSDLDVPGRCSAGCVRFTSGVGFELLYSSTRCHHTRKRTDTKQAQLTVVLEKIHELLITNSYATKRDLYYNNVELFDKQVTLNCLLDDIAVKFEVPRRCLHVMSDNKGMLFGDLLFSHQDIVTDCRESSSMGTTVPNDIHDVTIISSSARFVLVIEKEATFQRLLDDKFCEKFGPCIIITGFPDVSTRRVIHILWTLLEIPILGLVDCDPYGIEILTVFKFGSMSLAYNSHDLTCPCLKWIGVLPSDLARLSIPDDCLMDLAQRDQQRLVLLLQRPFMKAEPMWKEEVEVMVARGKKAEIQCFSASFSQSYLVDVYLPQKLSAGSWV
ncbi:meiotic recombination protein SPO11-like isoform X2 [Corticium candelabrum]|uniref:meiotic recombination protein SPO11-like isoform X2 n=1 Tax=Corticium candelabrum TaxID=121492 RepID=UPI002E263298|nr:meiotic recombination protein SPO11-like isoform X2 [Corticium candelabrum]